jgi:hypothetical protein
MAGAEAQPASIWRVSNAITESRLGWPEIPTGCQSSPFNQSVESSDKRRILNYRTGLTIMWTSLIPEIIE